MRRTVSDAAVCVELANDDGTTALPQINRGHRPEREISRAVDHRRKQQLQHLPYQRELRIDHVLSTQWRGLRI